MTAHQPQPPPRRPAGAAKTAALFASCVLWSSCSSPQTLTVDGHVDLGADAAPDVALHEVQTSCSETLRSGSSARPCRFTTLTAGCSVRDECCFGRVACLNGETIRDPITCGADRSTTCPGAAVALAVAGPTASWSFSRAWVSLGVGFDRHLTLIFADGEVLATCATPRLSITTDFAIGTRETLALLATAAGHQIAPATVTITESDFAGDATAPIHVAGSFSIPSWKVPGQGFSLFDCAELRTSGS